MNAEAHQEAIPACATTWKRTRYLIEGAQSIGRTGDTLSTGSSELVTGINDAPEGFLEGAGEEVNSCDIADVEV
jgi:hypothetical protein